MAKIPFDIKYRPQIESGEYKVETRDGSPARVVCWDANSCSPILFLVTEHDDLDDKDEEYAYSCNNFGRAFSIESPKDLFIMTPEPELTEFEQSVRDCIVENLTTHGREMSSTVFIDNETTKKLAAELLDIARIELNLVIGDYGQGYSAGYIDGKKDGKAEALKDLPRWKKCAPCNEDKATIPAWIVRFDADRANESAIVYDDYYICFGELERLPGFKED